MIVTAYVLSVIGIPVFLHYCGGELEEINYVVKGNSCCGDEDTSQPMDDSCCKDENIIIKNSTDFTLKQFNNYNLVKTFCNLFYISLRFSEVSLNTHCVSYLALIKEAPPKLQNTLVISTAVLRI